MRTADSGSPATQPTASPSPPRPASLQFGRGPDGVLTILLAGDWTGQAGQPGFEEFERELSGGALLRTRMSAVRGEHDLPGGAAAVKAIQFDASALGKWNSGLVAFVARCHDFCQAHQIDLRPGTLPPGLAGLIRLANAVPERAGAERKAGPAPHGIQRLGEASLRFSAETISMATFLGETVLAFVKLLRGRAQIRWSDTLLVMQQAGPQALGIVALINFLVGLILAFVGAIELERFGASIYVADLVAVATVREMGCIMTGIVLCGRTGAAFAAQLGTMKVNQETDAFTTFGISPLEFLVLPRVLALVLMMPLLCLFADLISIAGGFLVSTSLLQITPALFLNRTLEAITATNFLLGVFKGSFFGVLIALTGCLRGMQCGSNAAAVGEATTRAVVTGITAIIASDGIFAVICNVLNI